MLLIIALVRIGAENSSRSSSSDSSGGADGVTITSCRSGERHSSSSEDKDSDEQCISAYVMKESGNITLSGTTTGSFVYLHTHAVKFIIYIFKVSKGATIRNRYNPVPHLTQDANGKVINSKLDTTNDGQEVRPFPAGDHKAHINRRAQRHSKQTEQRQNKNLKDPQKKYRLGTVSKIFNWGA